MWKPNGGAEFIVVRFGARYSRAVPSHGVVTFTEASTLLRRGGRAVTRQTVYNLVAAGKLRAVQVRPYPGAEPIAAVRLSELRKFVERNGYDPVPLG